MTFTELKQEAEVKRARLADIPTSYLSREGLDALATWSHITEAFDFSDTIEEVVEQIEDSIKNRYYSMNDKVEKNLRHYMKRIGKEQ